MQLSDDAYLGWLIENSKNCIEEESIKTLVEAVQGTGCRGSVPVRVNGANLVVPCSQLPEAWANILHIFCLNDYRIEEEVVIGKGAYVVDVGAYLGFFSVYAARHIGAEGLIIAVEPNPYARRFLYENLMLNNLQGIARVDPRAIGICDDCLAEMYVPEYWANSSLIKSYVASNGENVRRTRVRVVRLASLLRDHNLEHVDLLKLDIEGFEEEVVRDAASLGVLEPGRVSQLVVEVHPPHTRSERIADVLRRLGYSVAIYRLGKDWMQEIVVAVAKQ